MKDSWKIEYAAEAMDLRRQTQQKGRDCVILHMFNRFLKLETYKSCD